MACVTVLPGDVPVFQATTRPMPDQGPLTEWVSQRNPLIFQRLGNGLVGRGQAHLQRFRGHHRLIEAADWWREVSRVAEVDDPLKSPGTGLAAFGTFTFADESQMDSVLVIPEVIIGRSAEGMWRTDIRRLDAPSLMTETRAIPTLTGSATKPPSVKWKEGIFRADDFQHAVAQAIQRITSGEADKVVLARDIIADGVAAGSWRGAIDWLASAYPDTHVFAVDGLVGASPETLARVERGALRLRVLAGSAARGKNPQSDADQARSLATSQKDLDEHRFALQSVAESLQGTADHLVFDESPFTLKLPNVWHLATDVMGQLPEGRGPLDVVSALHPTAAVAGSPRQDALRLITELEPFDRGRYAGPVGWVDGAGNGEWAIALRCAQWLPDGILTAFAGAGIVADSSPHQELLETGLKFLPIQQAFR